MLSGVEGRSYGCVFVPHETGVHIKAAHCDRDETLVSSRVRRNEMSALKREKKRVIGV